MRAVIGLLAVLVLGVGCAGADHLGQYTRQSTNRIFSRQLAHGQSEVYQFTAEDAEYALHNVRLMSQRLQPMSGAQQQMGMPGMIR